MSQKLSNLKAEPFQSCANPYQQKREGIICILILVSGSASGEIQSKILLTSMQTSKEYPPSLILFLSSQFPSHPFMEIFLQSKCFMLLDEDKTLIQPVKYSLLPVILSIIFRIATNRNPHPSHPALPIFRRIYIRACFSFW